MRVLALLPLLCAAQAAPAPCEVTQLLSAPVTYSAPDSARGQISVRVSCPGTGWYRVQFSTPAGPLLAPGGPVVLRGERGEVRGEIQGVPLDLRVQGSRAFDLPLVVPAGQWAAPGGTYQVLFAVTTEAVDGGRP